MRYIFDAIDQDQSGHLCIEELTNHLNQAGKGLSDNEIALLFTSMDSDRSNTIDFEEFGELMLRHRQLMAEYNDFLTYFLPIDADEDNLISLDEMNIAMASVGESPLTKDEIMFLCDRKGQLLTWNQFIEAILVI
ncbi:MAG: EF-hand domain-containing protein [Nostoc sp.]|uniref:EF-hand domain-containing protein n=1 Tax=Nostoc sp. TaxID=1180 RepID=UPI002FF9C293